MQPSGGKAPTRSTHAEFSTPLVPVMGAELDGNVTPCGRMAASRDRERGYPPPAALSNGKDSTTSAHRSKAIRTTRNILTFKRTPQNHDLLFLAVNTART
jgi:hypothetical protein